MADAETGVCPVSTTNALDDGFEEAEGGLDWLETLQARSPSDQAAYKVAEYVMKLRAAVTGLAGDRSAFQLSEAVGVETTQLVEDLLQAGAITTGIRGSVPPF